MLRRSVNVCLISARWIFGMGACVLVFLAASSTVLAQTGTEYIVTNNDVAPPIFGGFTVLTVAPGGAITQSEKILTNKFGVSGGYFAASRILAMNIAGTDCVFASEAYYDVIAGINMNTQRVEGNYAGSATDSGMLNGISLAMNQTYLYAGYSTSSTIGTFSVQPGCALSFIGDVTTAGLNGGTPDGMALHGNLLVVTYEDGSIESFSVASGMPVSNDDLQLSTGYATDNLPDGVQISANGRYAIFGDDSTTTTVEVSNISSGKLMPTLVYNLGTAFNSNNVLLSPDQTLLYITNNSSGQLTAAFFNSATGALTPGCTSATLNSFDNTWVYGSGLGTAANTGTGSQVYMAEYGAPLSSSIGVVDVQSNGTACTLLEDAQSPVVIEGFSALMSFTVYTAK
jgi:hypothetical protein